MPEGDTVYAAAKRMAAALSGKQLTRGALRHPRLAEHDLSGRTVLGVRSVRSTCLPVSMTDEACTRISGWTAAGTSTNPDSVGDGQATKPMRC
jgi:formamidopyrimidine-DNA glycosylase